MVQRVSGIAPLDNSISAYLFQAGNSSVPGENSIYSWVDLGDIPAAYNLTTSVQDPPLYEPPLTSVLICDPQVTRSGGTVRLDADGSLNVIRSGQPISVNNLNSDAVNFVFTIALIGAASAPEFYDTSTIAVNFITANMFLADPTVNTTQYPKGVPILDLASMNTNLNKYFSSASKAYVDGYAPPDDAFIPTTTVSTVSVDAQETVQKLALSTSRVILIVVTACIVVATVLLLFLGITDGAEWKQPLSLASVLEAMQQRETRVYD